MPARVHANSSAPQRDWHPIVENLCDIVLTELESCAQRFKTPQGATASLVTSKSKETYNVDWDRIESSVSPALASARLLHDARRMTDVSRWWTLRWTSNAVSLLSRACEIGTGKSCKLFRKLRRITTSYASELWLTIADRRHDANDQIEKEAVKAKWLRLQRLLGRAVNKRGLCMPGWVLVKNQPIYKFDLSYYSGKKLK